MADKTAVKHGNPNNMSQLAAGLFAIHNQRNSLMGKLTGKMPQGTTGAEATVRKQTTSHMPIVRCQDLTKGDGDEVTFHLLNPVNAKPIMGSEYAEGRGVGLTLSKDKLRVNQARFPVDMGDVMSEIRTPYDLRRMARPVAQSLMDKYIDQTLLVHMAGARGFHNNVEWVVPTEHDKDFKKIMVNPVKAPTKNRHFLADGAGVKSFAHNSGAVDITSADVLKMDTVDSMKSVLDQIALPPPMVRFEGDVLSEDSPLRVWLLSPAQYNKFAADPNFRTLQANALARANKAKQHPIFLGEVGIWNGFLMVKMNRPIRFYASDDIRYCDSHTSEVESVAKVPDSFGSNFAIDRSIILGGQAVAEALAAHKRSGIPFFWSEKTDLDHGDKAEVLIGAIRGVSKIRFDVDTGAGNEFTDYGVTVVDTAVPITGIGQ